MTPEATPKRKPHFSADKLNAGEALNRAHFLAMAPYAFQAACLLRDLGVLALLDESGPAGTDLHGILDRTGLSRNAVISLTDAGLGTGLLYYHDDLYFITKAGQYFLNDATVRANTNFMRDVCLPGIAALEESLRQSGPVGLAAFGDWGDIFQALPALPESAQKSWYAFNNHHSNTAFADALPHVLARAPQSILDLGGATGHFALAALDRSPNLHIGIADLTHEALSPGIPAAIKAGKVSLHPIDVLQTADPLPAGYDTIWMSQFLPCFSEAAVAIVLGKCREALPAGGTLWLMEAFWDRQRHEAAAAALQLNSLYFVNMATGQSRMYTSVEVLAMAVDAGFEVVAEYDGIGRGHTLIQLQNPSLP